MLQAARWTPSAFRSLPRLASLHRTTPSPPFASMKRARSSAAQVAVGIGYVAGVPTGRVGPDSPCRSDRVQNLVRIRGAFRCGTTAATSTCQRLILLPEVRMFDNGGALR